MTVDREDQVQQTCRDEPAGLSVQGKGDKALFARTPLVDQIFSALRKKQVRCCKWKSNVRLAMTLLGAADIDLLVDMRDAQSFREAFLGLGFKPTRSRAGLDHPGLIHALGLDEGQGRLIDLHACFQIVSGDKLVKVYRFPVERELLARVREIEGIRVPSPEAELVLFTLRMALRHVSLIELLRATLREKIVDELEWILQGADLNTAATLCEAWFPEIDDLFFRYLFDRMQNGSLVSRVIVGWRVSWRMRYLRRLGVMSSLVSRLWRLSIIVRNKIRQRKDLTLETGGLIVAVVGPKATGKTTIVRELKKALGQQLDVVSVHVGKPSASLLSVIPNLLIPLARKAIPQERLTEYERPEKRATRHYSLFYALRMALLAHDRKKLLVSALREATSGTIVICDRYPSATIGATDSSRFDDEAVALSRSRFKRWVMERERSNYASMPKANLVLRLKAPLDVAVQRDAARGKEGGPDAESVRRRWELENHGEFPGVQVVEIDTSQPLEETVRVALRAVWARL